MAIRFEPKSPAMPAETPTVPKAKLRRRKPAEPQTGPPAGLELPLDQSNGPNPKARRKPS